MTVFGKLLVSLIVAAVAIAATTLTGVVDPHPILIIAICGATIVTAFLVTLPAPVATGSPATAGQAKPESTDGTAAKRKSTKRSSAAGKSPREEGQVKWFNVSKGFGFITTDKGEEIFVHFRSIRGEGRRSLRDGERVSFEVAQSDKGPQAEDVEALAQSDE